MDSENSDSAATVPEMSVAGPGARLRAARETMRVDLPHIAAETRIPLRHLQSIEEDQFEDLPSRAYAIGFSRTFAKAVGLDPAEITDLVRAELADGTMRRTTPTSSMEPGDPARLPSSGLAWVAGAAVLILAIGAFAFYRTYFGAGTEPGSLLTPQTAATTAAPAATAPTPAPVPGGPVVLTATQDGIWVRIYEEGGERLTERTLARGESIEVPVTARDPRINTGRPDALTVTIGGQPVASLGDRPQTISGTPVSAAALLSRGTSPSATATSLAGETVPARAPTRRPSATRPLSAPAQTPAAEASSAAPAPAPAAEPATAPGR